ncbi:unnamed protein product [Nesidiocoris tenuis]|uniref:Uncharacterized protein n=1 Tax=Nesidiocoris tenuis TaxID=355587 RepID=A0A6H5G708_9HEMI|nr:unnamed protein product [Nesidiocoris tenuis]
MLMNHLHPVVKCHRGELFKLAQRKIGIHSYFLVHLDHLELLAILKPWTNGIRVVSE